VTSEELIEILQKNPGKDIEIESCTTYECSYGGPVKDYEVKDDVLTLIARE